jgi:hypothetical protein
MPAQRLARRCIGCQHLSEDHYQIDLTSWFAPRHCAREQQNLLLGQRKRLAARIKRSIGKIAQRFAHHTVADQQRNLFSARNGNAPSQV